jgi:hypothetical protein
MVFRVTDRGRGIPIDRLETIFERFQQVDASDSREKGGTGLGLAICRSIIEAHGGRIWAQSNPGHGSTFSFVVPAPLDASDACEPRAEGGQAPSVLVCDDDAAILEVTGTALEEKPGRVHARDLEDADRERLSLRSITHFLTERRSTSEELGWRVMNPTQGRTPELRHEPEAHSAGR